MIKKTMHEVDKVLSEANIDYELIFVDDGSNDKTWEEIIDASKINNKVKGVHFPEILGKSLLSWQDFRRLPEIVAL